MLPEYLRAGGVWSPTDAIEVALGAVDATRIGSGVVPLPTGPISSGDSAQKTPVKTK